MVETRDRWDRTRANAGEDDQHETRRRYIDLADKPCMIFQHDFPTIVHQGRIASWPTSVCVYLDLFTEADSKQHTVAECRLRKRVIQLPDPADSRTHTECELVWEETKGMLSMLRRIPGEIRNRPRAGLSLEMKDATVSNIMSSSARFTCSRTWFNKSITH